MTSKIPKKRSLLFEEILWWPLMNADERGFGTTSFCFSICVHQRSSAANPVFAFFPLPVVFPPADQAEGPSSYFRTNRIAATRLGWVTFQRRMAAG
jgi:hypothetical protein